jgi:hypothetical protein
VEVNCPWFGSKLNGTLMSFASGRFPDSERERGFSARTTGAPGPACRLPSCEAAEARGQPEPKEIEIIASAVTARSARAWSATEDRSLVMLVVPFCPSRMTREFISPDYRFGFLATIKHTSNHIIGAVSLGSPLQTGRPRAAFLVRVQPSVGVNR